MAPPTTSPSFPDHGLLPREETGATAFLAQYPDYDGRGVIVAILDTGVDPGAAGLQVTSDGKPKIIDIIDCSGSGDVDTSTVVEALKEEEKEKEKEKEGGAPTAGATTTTTTIQGLSGRKLHLNPAWTNPTGKWHIGIKRAQELYPNGLKGRVRNERKKDWILEHRQVEAALQREVTEYKATHGSKPPTSTEEIDDLADKEARLSQLSEVGKGYDDAGALYDVIVWHTGERWEAAVDVQENGDLTRFKAMADYHINRDWRTFNTQLDNLNFSVNIYEEGKICSLTVDAGSHGTHVAGITAAYHPTSVEQNGLAPGAQIVSLKIGDSRLGSMETGVAVVRALRECVRLGVVDMINMSYGEAVAVNTTGRVQNLIEDIVNKHGVIYVGSASNNGPALSTVGAPGGSGTATIAAGAYLSPSMMEAGYSLRKPFEGGINFTWSSVGPSYDGEQGPTIMAPGGAVTSVPNWTLQKSMLMNGTSMAAPNACGSLALVLSALKAQKITYTPHLLRRALTHTALPLPHLHPLTQGHGMLQIPPAYDYIKAHHDTHTHTHLPLKVSVSGIKGNSCRGVYLREAGESKISRDFKVTVEPQFHEKALSVDKVNFESRIALSVVGVGGCVGVGGKGEGEVPVEEWVTIPNFFMLLNNGRGFNMTVDGSRLPHGLHFAKVVGHDVSHMEGGPVFEVPITVVKPLEINVDESKTKSKVDLGVFSFSSGQVARNFVTPPVGSTWMDVTVSDLRHTHTDTDTTTNKDGSSIIIALQTVQLLPQTPFRDAEWEKYIQLTPGQSETFPILIEAGTTVEIVLAQYTISEGNTTVSLSCEFRGLWPRTNTQDIVLQGGYGFTHLPIEAHVHDEELAPAAKLDKWQSKLVPSSSTIRPLDPSRDILPDGKQTYQLLLEYKHTCTEASGEEITPRAPLLNDVLYESPLEAQFMMAFDSNKKFLGCGDAWPSSIKCSKGETTFRYSIRHDDVSILQAYTQMPILLERALKNGKEVTLPDYATREEVMTKKKTSPSTRMLRRGCATSLFLAEPPFDKLPKGAKPGDILTGTLTLEKSNKDTQQPKSKRPKGFRLSYVVPPPPPEAPKPPVKPVWVDESKTEEEKMAEKVRDLKVAHLGGLVGEKKEKKEGEKKGEEGEKGEEEGVSVFERMYVKLLEEYPGHIPLLQARLKWVDSEKTRGERLVEVVAAAEAVIKEIDTQALALEFGVKVDENDMKAVKVRGEMEEKKVGLADALARKARALIDLQAQEEKKEGKEGKGEGKEDKKKKTTAATTKESVVDLGEEEAEKEKKKILSDGSSNGNKTDTHTPTPTDEVTLVLSELKKWDTLEQDKYARLVLERDARKGRWGLVLKLLNKLLGDSGNGSGIAKEELHKRRYECYEKLGWVHLLENEKKWRVIDSPKEFYLF